MQSGIQDPSEHGAQEEAFPALRGEEMNRIIYSTLKHGLEF